MFGDDSPVKPASSMNKVDDSTKTQSQSSNKPSRESSGSNAPCNSSELPITDEIVTKSGKERRRERMRLKKKEKRLRKQSKEEGKTNFDGTS